MLIESVSAAKVPHTRLVASASTAAPLRSAARANRNDALCESGIAHRAEIDDDQPEAARLEEQLGGLELGAPFALLRHESAALVEGGFFSKLTHSDAREVGARRFEAARIECARNIDPSDDLATTRSGARECRGYRRLARADGAGDLADAAACEAADERIERDDAAGETAFLAGQLVAFEDS